MTAKIDYLDRANITAIGRNGQTICTGIGLTHLKSCVVISPINSKGKQTNCRIPVPHKDIDELIKALQTLKTLTT